MMQSTTSTDTNGDNLFLGMSSQQQVQDDFDSFLSDDVDTTRKMTTNPPMQNGNGNGNIHPLPNSTPFNPNNHLSGSHSSGNSYGTQSQPQQNVSLWARLTSCFQFATYQAYFDVTTDDVLTRIKNSVLLFNVPGGFREVFLANNTKIPDAYGPFWLAATFVFVLAASSHLFKWFNGSYDDFDYKVHHLINAALIVYGFTFGVPLILSLAFTCLSVEMGFVELFSLYGYALVPYIPATLLCFIPIHALIWTLLITGTLVSAIFVLRNVIGPIMSAEIHRRGMNAAETTAVAAPLLGTVVGAHFIFLLIIKLGFYHF